MITLRMLPFLVTAISYLFLGLWIVARRRSGIQRLYGVLCLTTFSWQGIWAILFVGGDAPRLYDAMRFCYMGIVFVPAIFYHFIIDFTGEETRKGWLKATYALSGAFAAAVWVGHAFINGFHMYSWGVAARAGILYPLFSVLITVVIGRTLILIARMENSGNEIKQRQTSLVKIATLLYCGGSLDLLSNYGISVYPLSFLFVGSAVLLFGYATIRYEFLAITIPRETEDDRARRELASAEMRRLGMAAAFPLVSQGELMGFLLLGEKMSEETYSQEDLLLLRIVANQAALAHQRVRYLELAVHGARTEMLGEIAGGFAHEIKTPLANISLPAELSLMDIQDLQEGKRSLEEVLPALKDRLHDIMSHVFKVGEKIEAIRQFSKPGQIQLSPVDLSKTLKNTVGLLDHLLRKSNITLRVQLPTMLPQIRGDAKQLEIVFVNLMKNATEAMANHPSSALARELSVKAWEDGDSIVASVKDSGPGISRTHIGHMFEAYFTTKGSEGTGMGLFLSHQVIKAHGGSIDVRSEEGKGAEFIIRLPKYAAQEQPGKAVAA